MQLTYKVSEAVTDQMLKDKGFRSYGAHDFYLHKNLYKTMIYAKLILRSRERELEYEVIDKNSGTTYLPYYANPNGDNNKVCITVIGAFNEFIAELAEAGIIEEE